MKNIAFLLVSRGVGGVEKRFSNLFLYLDKNPYESQTITLFVSRSQAICQTHFKNIKIIPFGTAIPKSKNTNSEFIFRYIDYIGLIFKLIFQIRTSFEIVHFVTTSSLLFHKFIRGKKNIYSFVASAVPEQILSTKPLLQLIPNMQIDCLSKTLWSYVKSQNILPSQSIFFAPCSFIDHTKCFTKTKKRQIAFISRFEKDKGIEELLLPSIPLILSKFPHLTFQIIGSGSLEEMMRVKLNPYILHGSIFMGFLKNPELILSETLIFLSLQKIENYPSQSLLEAMSSSCAIIATDVGETKDIVKPEFGIKIKPEIHDLCQAVEKLLLDLDNSLKMGVAASHFVRKHHRIEVFYQYLFNEIYRL